ncbi:MAG: MoaD/ThiS family protein [Thermoanaerobaculia bacterium]
MRIRLLAFASAADALGRDAQEIELADGADVAALRRELAERFPSLAGVLPRAAIAVDGEIGAAGRPLAGATEVAILPPVSGG